ncbi:MAG: M20 metallopeptidase family protein, partial [bacterium]
MLERAKKLSEELVRLRREVHKYPELGFREFRTARLVADTLEEIGGFAIKTGVGRTGVVGEIGDGDGPTIAIRADMDALPLAEQNDVPYRSQNEGVMHACGHDAHTAMLLGAAHLLRHCYGEERWQGRVRLLFQPSEEMFDEDGISGATAMIEDGALEGVDAVIALHVDSTEKAGRFLFHDGRALAAVDSFEAWIYASGAHGAAPHKGTDPLFMLGPVLNAIYAIPSRRINPIYPSVVSLGQVSGGSASNVIPSEVYIQGTLRSYQPQVREQLWEEVERALALSRTLGGDYKLSIQKGYPPLHNDGRVNDWMRTVVADLTGADHVVEDESAMGAEDFAYMTQLAPGAMVSLGAALDDDVRRAHHTPIFDIDESVLPLGAAMLAETARRYVVDGLSL